MQAGHNGEPRQAERHKKGQRQLRRQGCCCLSKNWEQRLDQPIPCMTTPILMPIRWRFMACSLCSQNSHHSLRSACRSGASVLSCSKIYLATSEQHRCVFMGLTVGRGPEQAPATRRCSNKMALLCCIVPGPPCFCATTASCAELLDMVATSAAMSSASHSFKYLRT